MTRFRGFRVEAERITLVRGGGGGGGGTARL